MSNGVPFFIYNKSMDNMEIIVNRLKNIGYTEAKARLAYLEHERTDKIDDLVNYIDEKEKINRGL